MLEKKFKRIKLGYDISSKVIMDQIEPEKSEHFLDPIHVQRMEAFIRGHYDSCEVLGYLLGLGCSFLKHPFKTYRLLRGE